MTVARKQIFNDIRGMTKPVGLLSAKYKDERLFNETQRIFSSLPVQVAQAINIRLQ